MNRMDADAPTHYLPVRSRCLHPGQQQGRRWPSLQFLLGPANAPFSVISCLASSDQQMNYRCGPERDVLPSIQCVGLATSALSRSAGSLCTTPPGTRVLVFTGQGSGPGASVLSRDARWIDDPAWFTRTLVVFLG